MEMLKQCFWYNLYKVMINIFQFICKLIIKDLHAHVCLQTIWLCDLWLSVMFVTLYCCYVLFVCFLALSCMPTKTVLHTTYCLLHHFRLVPCSQFQWNRNTLIIDTMTMINYNVNFTNNKPETCLCFKSGENCFDSQQYTDTVIMYSWQESQFV